MCEKSWYSLWKWPWRETSSVQRPAHAREKPYQCKFCWKSSSKNVRLRMHQIIHTGGTPYDCEDCGRRSSRSGMLQNHLCTCWRKTKLLLHVPERFQLVRSCKETHTFCSEHRKSACKLNQQLLTFVFSSKYVFKRLPHVSCTVGLLFNDVAAFWNLSCCSVENNIIITDKKMAKPIKII